MTSLLVCLELVLGIRSCWPFSIPAGHVKLSACPPMSIKNWLLSYNNAHGLPAIRVPGFERSILPTSPRCTLYTSHTLRSRRSCCSIRIFSPSRRIAAFACRLCLSQQVTPIATNDCIQAVSSESGAKFHTADYKTSSRNFPLATVHYYNEYVRIHQAGYSIIPALCTEGIIFSDVHEEPQR